MLKKFTYSSIIFSLIFVASSLVFMVISAPSALAVNFTSIGNIQFNQSSTDKVFYRVTIKASELDEITVDHGLNFILPKSSPIQWYTKGNGNITFSGSAADKVNPEVTFSDDLYILHLDVNANFAPGEELNIDGLTPITYKKSLSARNLGLDINGDLQADVYNINSFSVKDVARSDFTAPFIPQDLRAEYNAGTKEVKISWTNPPDYDWMWTALDRQTTVGTTKTRVEIYKGLDTTFTDKNINTGDVIRYMVYAADTSNNVTQSFGVDLVTVVAPVVVTPPVVTPPTTPVIPPVVEDAEKTSLTKYLNYYDLRYQIKCLATGVSKDGDNCLFAKIDLLYAQEKLGVIKANISLTASELTLLTSRIKWPELRYKQQCTEVISPANFCSSLKEGIDRTKYFINKK